MSDIKYPNIEVQLSGTDGNAMSIIARVRGAMKRNGVPQEELEKFLEEVTGGDYDNVLVTCMRWVDVV